MRDRLLEELNDQWELEDRLRPDHAPMPAHRDGYRDLTLRDGITQWTLRRILRHDFAPQVRLEGRLR